MTDQDTDQLFRCLRQVGARPLEGTILSEGIPDQAQIKSLLIKPVSGDKASPTAPKKAVRLTKDDMPTGPVKKAVAYMPAPKPRKTIGFMPVLKKAVANIEAGLVTHAHNVVKNDRDLRHISAIETPREQYYRRRLRLAMTLDIGLDGLERQFGIFDRKARAMFFAQLLEVRQFDTFANHQVWFAAKMEKRISFLNDILQIHSKIYQLTPARIDGYFTGEVPTNPDSAIGHTALSAFDPEQQKILINPPFWHNAVTFEAMIGTVIEQNCRNHARQMCRLYDGGQLRADDPRYGQSALFSAQWHVFELARQSRETEEERRAFVTGRFIGGNDIEEIGFDEYANHYGEAIRMKLVDLLSGAATASNARAMHF